MSDDLLRQLAVRAGIAPDWTDQGGVGRQVAPDTLRAILQALGLPCESDDALRHSLQAVESPPPDAAPFVTTQVGEPVDLPAAGADGTAVEVVLESGERHCVMAGQSGGQLRLPAFEEPGYHSVHLPGGTITVAAAPARCITFSDLSGGETGWGLAAQIYSLRSADDGGIGNFAGVAALARAAGACGADVLAISPVHALYGALPGLFSPYSPSSRLFSNPLHADPAAALPHALVREVIAREGLAAEMERLSALARIDWHAAAPLRQRVLRALFEAVHDGACAAARAAFERFADHAAPALRAHAVFEALHAAELARDPGARSWRDWRPAYRDPRNPEVAGFAVAHAREVRHQIFLQWLADRSQAAAQAACRAAGMRVGLIADLAIGIDGGGSDAWSRQGETLHGLSIGAPPDPYAEAGQNWALTTFSPRGLAASGYAPVIDTLRASLRHAGGLRIDHVMGMSRLWLIPEGAGALDGAYVRFPAAELFRLIALESHRHRAMVVGEDLGTVPHGFRDHLRAQGIAGLRVLRFERTQHGYVRPWAWDPDAVAMTSTHDLVPVAGWWAGSDFESSGGDAERESLRAWDRGVLWGALREAGLAEGERPAPQDTAPVVDAAIRYVAATPCTLKIVPLEDILGVRVQPNVPGTTTEKPNWRHRRAVDAEHLLDDAGVRRRLAILNGAGHH